MTTRSEALRALIPNNFPLATADDVRASLLRAKEDGEPGVDRKMASMMLRHGRLTDDAREWVATYLTARTAAS